MKIQTAEFIKGATRKNHYPSEGLPEIAFVGKSNVGKSSLINWLVNRKGLVKTSSTPGKTQMINFFRMNNSFFCVDLPGYGYAKVPMKIKASWGRMVENYLEGREELKTAIFLLDIRRDPGNDEFYIMNWFRHFQIPFITVLTKVDKAKKNELPQRKKKIGDILGIPTAMLTPTSVKTGLGKKELWKQICSHL